LPDPVLTSPDDIASALADPSQAAQGVVSMLRLLGIGIAAPSGTVLRAGSARAAGDFFLFEPEVRGLVDLARRSTDDDGSVAFRDVQAALGGLGLRASAEDLAAAYEGAYEAHPDAPISRLVSGLGGVDVDGTIPRVELWLLLLDGFVPPNPGTTSFAPSGMVVAAAATSANSGWGVAAKDVGALAGLPLEVDPAIIAHLMLIAGSASVSVDVAPRLVHEGHGGPGAAATVTARVTAIADTFISPFSGRPLLPAHPGSLAGLPVDWQPSPVLDRHGTASPAGTQTTDATGTASFTFTPRQEAADGKGQLTDEIAPIQANVPADRLITALYGMPSLGALVGGAAIGFGFLDVQWHEGATMTVDLAEDYTVTIGAIVGAAHGKGHDAFKGTLARQPDGTWRGLAEGTSAGTYEGTAFGRSCTSKWNGHQEVDVVGQPAPDAIDGNFVFLFTPATPPDGDLGSGSCPRHVNTANGIDYLPYNDFSISNAREGQGLVVTLPAPPGGSFDQVTSMPGLVDATWHITIGYSR
jgi:hypothetical protein